MECGNCKYNDGLVYTSIPPKYKCTITNEFHFAFDDCNVEFAPVKHGRWIIREPFSDGCKNCNVCIECSVCHTFFGHEHYAKTPYCPMCGAKMDEV